MAAFKIILTPRATNDLNEIYDYIAIDSPANARQILQRLLDAAESLSELPERFGQAREARQFKRQLRQLVVVPYRIVYEIRGTVVNIITVRHAKRLPLPPDQ